MVHLFTELSKYTMIILFALYTYQCFSALKRNVEAERQAGKLGGRCCICTCST